MDIETTKCDYCGTIKMESNHWWTTRITTAGFIINPYYKGKGKLSTSKDCCSESCLQKAIKEFIASVNSTDALLK